MTDIKLMHDATQYTVWGPRKRRARMDAVNKEALWLVSIETEMSLIVRLQDRFLFDPSNPDGPNGRQAKRRRLLNCVQDKSRRIPVQYSKGSERHFRVADLPKDASSCVPRCQYNNSMRIVIRPFTWGRV